MLTVSSPLGEECLTSAPLIKFFMSRSLSAACSRAAPAGRERSTGVAAGAARSLPDRERLARVRSAFIGCEAHLSGAKRIYRAQCALLGCGARPGPAPAPEGAAAAPPRHRQATGEETLRDRQDCDLEGPSGHCFYCLFVLQVVSFLWLLRESVEFILSHYLFFFSLRFSSNMYSQN